MKMDDQIKDMWMNTKMNNNINIILIDNLESLHQRKFGLQSFQQWVVLTSDCHERLTNIKVGWNKRKWKRNELVRAPKIDFSCTNFFVFLCFFVLIWLPKISILKLKQENKKEKQQYFETKL